MGDYSYKLSVFEGPLDLLLHLIEKHKIDIYDIPIVSITSQYMDYLDNWNHLDIHYSSEFLVMAATLMQIKSRMLLPKVEQPLREKRTHGMSWSTAWLNLRLSRRLRLLSVIELLWMPASIRDQRKYPNWGKNPFTPLMYLSSMRFLKIPLRELKRRRSSHLRSKWKRMPIPWRKC